MSQYSGAAGRQLGSLAPVVVLSSTHVCWCVWGGEPKQEQARANTHALTQARCPFTIPFHTQAHTSQHRLRRISLPAHMSSNHPPGHFYSKHAPGRTTLGSPTSACTATTTLLSGCSCTRGWFNSSACIHAHMCTYIQGVVDVCGRGAQGCWSRSGKHAGSAQTYPPHSSIPLPHSS